MHFSIFIYQYTKGCEGNFVNTGCWEEAAAQPTQVYLCYTFFSILPWNLLKILSITSIIFTWREEDLLKTRPNPHQQVPASTQY